MIAGNRALFHRTLLLVFAVVAFVPPFIPLGKDSIPASVEQAWILEFANTAIASPLFFQVHYFGTFALLVTSLVLLFFGIRAGLYLFIAGLFVVLSNAFFTPWNVYSSFQDVSGALFWLLSGMILVSACRPGADRGPANTR